MAEAGDNDIEWEAENEEIVPVEAPNDEDESHIHRNEDGSFDGGVAVGPESNKVTAVECDLVSFVELVQILHTSRNFFISHVSLKDAISRMH